MEAQEIKIQDMSMEDYVESVGIKSEAIRYLTSEEIDNIKSKYGTELLCELQDEQDEEIEDWTGECGYFIWWLNDSDLILDYITGSKEYREEYFSDFKDWLEGEINQVLEDKTDTFNLQIEKEYNNGQQEE
jgi:hypothetical protein